MSPGLPRWYFAGLLAVIAGGYLLVSSWSSFPYFYHTDEPGKVRQVIEGERNFHHPLLMIESVAWLVRVGLVEAEPQAVAEAGRGFSALCCAVAAGLLGWVVARWSGPWAGLLAAALLLFHPDVQEYGRYFKEDPALLLGCAAVVAAMAAFERRPVASRAVAVGAAVGLAASAKYVGAVMLLPGVAVLAAGASRRDWRCWAALVGGLIAVMLVVNFPMLTQRSTFLESLQRETSLVIEGHADTRGKETPHAGYFQRWLQRSWHVLPFCLVGLAAAWRSRRRGWTPVLLSLSPLLWAILLGFSTKDSGRYFLPASLGIAGSAAAGVMFVSGWVADPRRRRVLVGVSAAVVLGLSFGRSSSYLDGFRSDGRALLFDAISDRMVPGSIVIQGRKVCLPDSRGLHADGWHRPLPPGIELLTEKYIADEWTWESLKEAGVTHLAMAGDEYERYLKKRREAKAGAEGQFEKRLEFYEQVFREAELVWMREAGKVGTHQPELRLYQLPWAPVP